MLVSPVTINLVLATKSTISSMLILGAYRAMIALIMTGHCTVIAVVRTACTSVVLGTNVADRSSEMSKDFPTTSNQSGIYRVARFTDKTSAAGNCLSFSRKCCLSLCHPSIQRCCAGIITGDGNGSDRLAVKGDNCCDIILSSKSLERHNADHQNSNQHQTEHLLHYCFHFVSNLLMKLYVFEIVPAIQIAALWKRG